MIQPARATSARTQATTTLDELRYSGAANETELLVSGFSEQEQIQQALAHLPSPQRNAIDLAYYGGYTCAEIAARTGVPLGTVKTRLRLGLFKLRTLLSDPSGE